MARKSKKAKKPNAIYKMPRELGGQPDKLVLAMDPGSRNFGIALVGLENGQPRCYMNSVMMRPVNDLVAFAKTRRNFLLEISGWMKHGPTGMIAERFQSRGGSSMGPLIEQVSAMLGLLGGTYPELPIKLTIASAWKNAFNKKFAEEYHGHELYSDTEKADRFDLRCVYPHIDVQPHQLDASLIGLYGLEQGLGITIDFDLHEWIMQVEATSLIGLRKRRS